MLFAKKTNLTEAMDQVVYMLNSMAQKQSTI